MIIVLRFSYLFLISFYFLFSSTTIKADSTSNLSEESRIKIIRTLGSEYVALKVPLPINKVGLMLNSSGEFDWKKNEEASLSAGQFIAPGITVQITKIDISTNKMTFEINGGGRKKKRRFLEKRQENYSSGRRHN